MKKVKKEISIHDCITCTSGFHKGKQYPRPTCVKIYFEGDEERWVQICEECWNKLNKTVTGLFNEHHKQWGDTLVKMAKEIDKK